ncbi:hypothetical protein BDW22DRAFT_1481751 [Trametopsis cervina]|nr:hypothetical protein BDW22DRAFT_1481751 [Trametopsis cervina]
MKMGVRCDMCLLLDTASKATPATASTSSRAAGSPSTHREGPAARLSADDLVDALATLNITSGTSASTNGVDIVKGGVKVRQSALVKIKTRSSRNAEAFDWTSAYL